MMQSGGAQGPPYAPVDETAGGILASEVLTIIVGLVSIVTLGITSLLAVRRILADLADEVHRLALAVERIDTHHESTTGRLETIERRLEALERQ